MFAIRRVVGLGFCVGMLGATAVQAETFSATLNSIRVNARPGQVVTRPFELTLEPEESRKVFKAQAEDWWRSEDGKQSFYAPPGRLRNSCGPWVTLNPVEESVEPGGTLRVRITVSVPVEVRPGGYWCALTVDEVPDPLAVTPEQSVGVKFMASVSVGIFVYIDPIERSAEILDVQVAGEEAQVRLRNGGNTPLAVEGRFEFLHVNGDEKPVAVAPMARSTLLTEPSPVGVISAALPGLGDLPSGRYLMRAIIDIGLDHYIGVEKEIEVLRQTADARLR